MPEHADEQSTDDLPTPGPATLAAPITKTEVAAVTHSSPNAQSPRTTSPDDGYIVRKWGGSLKKVNGDLGEETEFTEEKLSVLRRLAMKMEQNRVKTDHLNSRKHARRTFADVVQVIPLDYAGQPEFPRRLIAFCRNISPGGCSLLHTRLLLMKELVVFFPHLADGTGRHAAIQGKIIRDRPLSLGMYELAVQFEKLVPVSDEELRILHAASKTSNRS